MFGGWGDGAIERNFLNNSAAAEREAAWRYNQRHGSCYEDTQMKRAIVAAAGVAAGAGFALLCPDIGLGEQGVRCLGVLIMAVVWWVGNVLPPYATALVMVVLFSVFGGVESKVALSAFSSDTWWLLVAAFGLGAAMKESGLLHRMALAIVRLFPSTFGAQVAGLVAAGTLVGPLVPSMAAKVTMLTPLAMEIGDTLGYERFGKPMQGLFLAMFTGVRTVAPAVLSASVIGYCLLGLLPTDVQAQFGLVNWLVAALPWFAFVTVLNYLAIVFLYRPRVAETAATAGAEGESAAAVGAVGELGGPFAMSEPGKSADASKVPDASGVSETRAVLTAGNARVGASPLGPLTRRERRMCAIIAATVVLWVTEPAHHVAAHIVALAAFALVVACDVLDKGGFRRDISWESLVFVGAAMGLASVFQVTGIQDWVVWAAGPAFEAIAGNPYLFVAGAALITLALRFVVVSEMAYLNIVMVFLVPLSVSAGVNPWIAGFAMYAVITPWFTLYQSATYLASFYSVDGKMVRHADMARYCVVYTAICLAGLVASVPYWQWMGLL